MPSEEKHKVFTRVVFAYIPFFTLEIPCFILKASGLGTNINSMVNLISAWIM